MPLSEAAILVYEQMRENFQNAPPTLILIFMLQAHLYQFWSLYHI